MEHEDWLYDHLMQASRRLYWDDIDTSAHLKTLQAMLDTWLYVGITPRDFATWCKGYDAQYLRDGGLIIPDHL